MIPVTSLTVGSGLTPPLVSGVTSTSTGTTSSAGGALTLATASGATPYYIAMQSAASGTTALAYVTSTFTFTPSTGVLNATATSAQYADLAEIYLPDAEYNPGTVVIFGGDNEITVTSTSHDTRVAGVISTNPAYLMNNAANGLPVALTGRVPCQVLGPVSKGTLLVTSSMPGVAQAIDESQYRPGCVIGKSLEAIDDNSVKTIEIAVGRF
jgi:hypothetical protein